MYSLAILMGAKLLAVYQYFGGSNAQRWPMRALTPRLTLGLSPLTRLVGLSAGRLAHFCTHHFFPLISENPEIPGGKMKTRGVVFLTTRHSYSP